MTGVLGESYRDIKEIKKTVTTIRESLSDQERDKVVSWIQQNANPSTIHNMACDCRREEDNTGDWMLRMKEWRMWIDPKTSPPSRLLWVHGIPGSGKTVFASFLIDQCLKYARSIPGNTTQCIYYYCSYRHNRDESDSFLRWLVSQACRSLHHIPSKILQLFKMDHHPNIRVLMGALEELLGCLEVLYVVVDGVDESKEPRDDFLDILVRIATSPQFGKVRLLATSRLYANIRVRLEPCSIIVPMSNEEVDKDIRKFVTREVSRTWKAPWQLLLKDKVIEKLVTGAQGMFQWASCQVRILNRKRNGAAIEQALKELPKDLDETYERMLSEIPEDSRATVRNVFVWLYGHDQNRPKEYGFFDKDLPMVCLLHGLNPHKASQHQSDTEGPDLQSDHLEDVCGCLITVFRAEVRRSNTSLDCVKFSHYTVLEYLLSDRLRGRDDHVSFFSLTSEECKASHLRQVLTAIPQFSDELDFAEVPCSQDSFDVAGFNLNNTFHAYCVLIAIGALMFRSESMALGDDLWDIFFEVNIPRLLRSSFVHARELLLCLVQWDGDPKTADGVWLCDLVLNYQYNNKEPAMRCIEKKGGRDLFNCKIRGGYGRRLTSYNPKFQDFETEADWCYMESPLALVGICQLLGWISNSTYYEDSVNTAFERLTLLSLEYMDQIMVLYTIIPLHFDDITCGYGEEEAGYHRTCSLLAKILNHGASLDLNNTGYRITPLQLAVYCCKLSLVRGLVENGAEVNGIGLKNGDPLPESTIYHMSERWSSATPLHILRNAGYGLGEFRRRVEVYSRLLANSESLFLEPDPYSYDEDDRRELEQFLVDNGAVDDGGTGVRQTAERGRLHHEL